MGIAIPGKTVFLIETAPWNVQRYADWKTENAPSETETCIGVEDIDDEVIHDYVISVSALWELKPDMKSVHTIQNFKTYTWFNQIFALF